MIKHLCGIALCALLVACGSSDPAQPPVTPPPPPPPVALDVSSQVDTQLMQAEASTETSEPVSIDAVTVPALEDTEPKAL